MRRKVRLVAVLSLVALLAGACAPAAAPTVAPQPTPTAAPAPAPPIPTAAAGLVAPKLRYGGILRTVQPTSPAHFSLHEVSTVRVLNPLGPAYDGLVQFDPLDPSQITPDLAESWDISPDGMVYTFHLFKGVKLHDGQPVTAADVKASLDRIRKPPKGMVSPWQIYLERVKEIQVGDDYTVKLVLAKPDTSLIPHLAVSFMVVYANHALEKGENMKKVVLGTGPYKFKEYLAGTSVSLVRNPDYFVEGRPFLDGIITYIIPDAGALSAALRTAKIDFVPSSPGISVSVREILAREKSSIVVQTRPGLAFRSSTFNLKRKPWDDARVRRAVSLVVDRQAVLKVAEQGDGVVGAALPPSPHGDWGISLNEIMQLPGYRYPKDADIAEAKRLMAEAGFPDGLETTFITRDESLYVDNAVALQGEVRKIGIRAVVKSMERGAATQAQNYGNFDIYAGSNSLRLDDPSELGPQYVTGGWKNYGGYENPKIESLYDQLLTTLDVSKRKAIALEMQKILLEDNPQIVHYWVNDVIALWPYVKNYKIGGMYTHNRMRDVWLEK